MAIGWKVLFALCPPPHVLGGWACFVVALIFIGLVTAVVADVATLMGCVVGMPTGITAITFVAIGTSLPDTFASKHAAQQSRYADEAVGNITGSNSVNVFLGLGLPWVIATMSQEDNTYMVPAKGLTLSVVLYLCCSVSGFIVLIVRRMTVKGELGGSSAGRYGSALFFFILWLTYVVLASLGTVDIITLG